MTPMQLKVWTRTSADWDTGTARGKGCVSGANDQKGWRYPFCLPARQMETRDRLSDTSCFLIAHHYQRQVMTRRGATGGIYAGGCLSAALTQTVLHSDLNTSPKPQILGQVLMIPSLVSSACYESQLRQMKDLVFPLMARPPVSRF